MTVSEYIQKLHDLLEQHGDVPVLNEQGQDADMEFNDDPTPAVIVY